MKKDFFGQEHAKNIIKLLERIAIKNNSNENKYLPQGILVYGNPGTGKTLFAKVLANKLNKNLILVDQSMTDEKLKEVFSISKSSANNLILLDEIDLIVKEKGSGMLLAELDNNPNLFVVATTSEDIDSYFWFENEALKRPGRFDFIIKMNLPTDNERIEYFKNNLNDSYNINLLSKMCSYKSYAFLNMFVRRIQLEEDLKEQLLSDSDLISLFDKINADELPILNHNMFNQELVSIHEIGHFIMGLIVGRIPELVYYSKHKFSGLTTFKEYEIKRNDVFDNIVIGLGGLAATKLIYGVDDYGSSSDLYSVKNEIKHTLNNSLIFNKVIPHDNPVDISNYFILNKEYDNLVNLIIKNITKLNIKILSKFKEEINELKDLLLSKQVLDIDKGIDIVKSSKRFEREVRRYKKNINQLSRKYKK